MGRNGASVPQYLRSLQADATDFRAEKQQPVSRRRVHDLRNSGLLARQRSMAWLFRKACIAQVEFVLPNVFYATTTTSRSFACSTNVLNIP